MLYCSQVVSKRVWEMDRQIEICLEKSMMKNSDGRDEGHVKRIKKQDGVFKQNCFLELPEKIKPCISSPPLPAKIFMRK